MTDGTISRRTALTAAVLTAAAFASTADAAESNGRSAQEEKNLQAVLAFWKDWEGDPISKQAIMAKMADKCSKGEQGQIIGEGKETMAALVQSFIDEGNRYKADVIRTFVSGPVVITDLAFSTWKKGAPPPSSPVPFVSIFIFEEDKIGMWMDIRKKQEA
jgi:hypothetical protein